MGALERLRHRPPPEGHGGSEKGELRQAEVAFKKVTELGRAEGWLNLARVYNKEGRLDDAARALGEAARRPGEAPPWVLGWLSALVNRQNGKLEAAIEGFEAVLATRVEERGFDFSKDYVIRNELGVTLFQRARQLRGEERRSLLTRARDEFRRTLEIDSENHTAHYNLAQIERAVGNAEARKRHLELFERFRPDDNAQDRAVRIHRDSHPAADHAAQTIVIYDLR